jgi:hypothetical protein
VLQQLRRQQQQEEEQQQQQQQHGDSNASILRIISQRLLDEMNVSSSWTEEQLQMFFSSSAIVL